jgi:p-aminobenzoyl-glutamate transporter AbgT
MEKYTTELNPLSSDNLTMFLIISIIMGTLLVIMILVDKFIIPRLNPDNKFRKFWEDHIIRLNPFEN